MTTLLERPAPIHDDATRRQFLIGGAALAALLVGCSGSDAEAPTSSGSGGDRFPVTIKHRYGRTMIPREPQRVVSVGITEQDALPALGVIPVATTEYFGEHPGAIHPWARDALGDAALPEVLSEELDFEKIAALRPDLILGTHSGMTDQDYPKLSAIAPTVAQSEGYPNYSTPWQEETATIGRATGRALQAQALVAEVEAQFAQACKRHPNPRVRARSSEHQMGGSGTCGCLVPCPVRSWHHSASRSPPNSPVSS